MGTTDDETIGFSARLKRLLKKAEKADPSATKVAS
jgi:hypothetical protein